MSVASNLIMMIHIVDAAVPTKSGVGGQLISKNTGDSTHGMVELVLYIETAVTSCDCCPHTACSC